MERHGQRVPHRGYPGPDQPAGRLDDQRVVSLKQGEELAQKLNLSYIETSAKTGENINDAFKMLGLQLIKRYVFTEEV